MQITVNAQPREIAAATLDAALIELGFAGPAIATALNGRLVTRPQRDGTRLTEGDRLEILAPMQGG